MGEIFRDVKDVAFCWFMACTLMLKDETDERELMCQELYGTLGKLPRGKKLSMLGSGAYWC